MAFGSSDRELVVRVVGDASSLDRTFKKASASASKFGSDISKTSRGAVAGAGAFGGLGRSIAFASAGFLGGFGLTAAIRSAFDELTNAQNVAATTNARIESTGAVAGVTAQHVEDLGKSLLNLTGIDDEVIKSGENMLLTFTNIRNVAGKNNDIFDQATLAALDMAKSFENAGFEGGSLQTTAVRLGKALQDPVKGATALRRVGVALTKSQIDLIKSLVESGNILEAQKIILREVRREFGGTAAAAGTTLSGKLGKLRETVRNVSADILEKLLPAITRVVDRATAWVQNLDNQKRIMDDVSQAGQVVAEVFGAIRASLEGLNKITGSTKRTVELLLAAFIAFKTAKLIGVMAGIAQSVGLIGVNARNARGEAVLLRGQLGAIGKIGLLAIPVVIALSITQTKEYKDFRKLLEKGPGGGDLSRGRSLADALFGNVQENLKTAFSTDPEVSLPAAIIKGIVGKFQKQAKRSVTTLEQTRAELGKAFGAVWSKVFEISRGFAKTPGFKLPLTRAESNQAFDSMISRLIDRVQDAPIKAQVRKLEKIAVLIEARIKATKGVQRRLELEDKLLDVSRQAATARAALVQDFIARLQFNVTKAEATATVEDDIAALNKLNAFLAKRIKAGGDTLALEQQQLEVQQKIIEVQKRRRDARQFKLLGFGPTGEDIVPGVKNLKRQLASVTDAIEGGFLDTRKTRARLRSIRRVLADGIGNVSADVRQKIAAIISDLKDQLKKSSVDVTRFSKTAQGQFTLAGARGGGAAGGITISGGVHIHGVHNLQELEDALRKRHKQRAHNRHGNR